MLSKNFTTISKVILFLSSLLMLSGIVQIFAQDFYPAGRSSRPSPTISERPFDAPQSQASGVALPNGVSLELKSRYPGVTMIFVAGVLQVVLLLCSALAEGGISFGPRRSDPAPASET